MLCLLTAFSQMEKQPNPSRVLSVGLRMGTTEKWPPNWRHTHGWNQHNCTGCCKSTLNIFLCWMCDELEQSASDYEQWGPTRTQHFFIWTIWVISQKSLQFLFCLAAFESNCVGSFVVVYLASTVSRIWSKQNPHSPEILSVKLNNEVKKNGNAIWLSL